MSYSSNDCPKKIKSPESNKEATIKKRIEYENRIETHQLWSKFIMIIFMMVNIIMNKK